jgi:hypothetical protein
MSGLGRGQGRNDFNVLVTDPAGAVVVGATVKLLSPLGAVDSKTDRNGLVQFENVRSGSYELRITEPGFVERVLRRFVVPLETPDPVRVVLQVIAGPVESCSANQTVDYAPANSGRPRLSGRVKDVDSGKGVAGVRLQLILLGRRGTTLMTESDHDGNFSFRHVASGHYRVTASKDGYETDGISDFVVAGDQSATLGLELGRGSICL